MRGEIESNAHLRYLSRFLPTRPQCPLASPLMALHGLLQRAALAWVRLIASSPPFKVKPAMHWHNLICFHLTLMIP